MHSFNFYLANRHGCRLVIKIGLVFEHFCENRPARPPKSLSAASRDGRISASPMAEQATRFSPLYAKSTVRAIHRIRIIRFLYITRSFSFSPLLLSLAAGHQKGSPLLLDCVLFSYQHSEIRFDLVKIGARIERVAAPRWLHLKVQVRFVTATQIITFLVGYFLGTVLRAYIHIQTFW